MVPVEPPLSANYPRQGTAVGVTGLNRAEAITKYVYVRGADVITTRKVGYRSV